MSKVKHTEDYKDHRYKKQVIIDYIANKISRKTASIKLHTSETYISTLKKRYLSDGDSIFVHGNKGKTGIKKLPAKVEGEICELYKTIYYDFNFQHFCDYARKSGELTSCLSSYEISDRGIARILNRHGILSPSHRRLSKGPQQYHPVRPRRAQFGELVQIDASIHDWLASSDEKWALYTAIDDATSIVLAAHIARVESTEGYFELLRRIMVTYGVPRTLFKSQRDRLVNFLKNFINNRDFPLELQPSCRTKFL